KASPSGTAPAAVRSASVTVPARIFLITARSTADNGAAIFHTLASNLSMHDGPTWTESGGHAAAAADIGSPSAGPAYPISPTFFIYGPPPLQSAGAGYDRGRSRLPIYGLNRRSPSARMTIRSAPAPVTPAASKLTRRFSRTPPRLGSTEVGVLSTQIGPGFV